MKRLAAIALLTLTACATFTEPAFVEYDECVAMAAKWGLPAGPMHEGFMKRCLETAGR